MSKAKFHVAKGDIVLVTTGAAKGQQGAVLKIIAEKSQAIIEGVRLITKATKPNQQANQPGGLLKKEGPVHVSNLKLVTAKATGKKPAAKKAKAEKAPAKAKSTTKSKSK
jgi:large subunit ribosomal protein L24